MRLDQPAFEIFWFFNRPVDAHEDAISLHRRFPFRGETDDRRAFQLAAQKIGQIKIRRLHFSANQRFLLFFARRIRKLDNFHVDAVGFDPSRGQRVIRAKHAEAIAIVCEGKVHNGSQSEVLERHHQNVLQFVGARHAVPCTTNAQRVRQPR